MKSEERYQLVSFGLGGSSMVSDQSELRGYETPETFNRRLATDQELRKAIGAIALDKRALLQAYPILAYQSPMVCGRLKDREVDRFIEKTSGVAPFMVEAMSEGFGAVGALARLAWKDATVTGMDRVSVSVYVAWWRMHGARVGIVKEDGIEWTTRAYKFEAPRMEQGDLFGEVTK